MYRLSGRYRSGCGGEWHRGGNGPLRSDVNVRRGNPTCTLRARRASFAPSCPWQPWPSWQRYSCCMSPQARAQSDATAPLLLVANVDGTSLVLIYNELLNESPPSPQRAISPWTSAARTTPRRAVAVRGAEVDAHAVARRRQAATRSRMDYTVGQQTRWKTRPATTRLRVDQLELWTNHTGATNDRPEFSSDDDHHHGR